MYIKLRQRHSIIVSPQTSIQCPQCGHYSLFHKLGADITLKEGDYTISLGQRYCPREECRGHIFTVYHGNELVRLYPGRKIAFNREDIPLRILAAFDEAVVCHSNNCFVASAIMMRKTLEEICDEQGAEGRSLYKRLQNVSSKILIPKELIEAMNELRLLGNDAAHIELKNFEEIGRKEIEISIEFTKEILKAIYQYESLLDKLRSLKKP